METDQGKAGATVSDASQDVPEADDAIRAVFLFDCPFCGFAVHMESGEEPGLRHNPKCEPFMRLDVTEFMQAARRAAHPAPEECHAHLDDCDECAGGAPCAEGREIFARHGLGLNVEPREVGFIGPCQGCGGLIVADATTGQISHPKPVCPAFRASMERHGGIKLRPDRDPRGEA